MKVGLGLLMALALLDALLLYAPGQGKTTPVFDRRILGDKLANGSDNNV